MKYVAVIFSALVLLSCDPKDLGKLMDNLGTGILSDEDIARGLKEALELGVEKSVKTLSVNNGFYLSDYKIFLPEEAEIVVDKLKIIPGFASLEEEILKKINHAAEDAASKAGPIFISAIRELSFEDVMLILMGADNEATLYLHDKTYEPLYRSFKPVLVESLNKFGALDLWSDAVSKYNSLPFVSDVNPDLADHINTRALFALFDLIESKEAGIRNDISQRTSDLLKKVFARQDA